MSDTTQIIRYTFYKISNKKNITFPVQQKVVGFTLKLDKIINVVIYNRVAFVIE